MKTRTMLLIGAMTWTAVSIVSLVSLAGAMARPKATSVTVKVSFQNVIYPAGYEVIEGKVTVTDKSGNQTVANTALNSLAYGPNARVLTIPIPSSGGLSIKSSFKMRFLGPNQNPNNPDVVCQKEVWVVREAPLSATFAYVTTPGGIGCTAF